MHAQQSFLNVCNTAILGYHGDKIITALVVKQKVVLSCQQQIKKILYYFHQNNTIKKFLVADSWINQFLLCHQCCSLIS
jgi:hypothetical protein